MPSFLRGLLGYEVPPPQRRSTAIPDELKGNTTTDREDGLWQLQGAGSPNNCWSHCDVQGSKKRTHSLLSTSHDLYISHNCIWCSCVIRLQESLHYRNAIGLFHWLFFLDDYTENRWIWENREGSGHSIASSIWVVTTGVSLQRKNTDSVDTGTEQRVI